MAPAWSTSPGEPLGLPQCPAPPLPTQPGRTGIGALPASPFRACGRSPRRAGLGRAGSRGRFYPPIAPFPSRTGPGPHVLGTHPCVQAGSVSDWAGGAPTGDMVIRVFVATSSGSIAVGGRGHGVIFWGSPRAPRSWLALGLAWPDCCKGTQPAHWPSAGFRGVLFPLGEGWAWGGSGGVVEGARMSAVLLALPGSSWNRGSQYFFLGGVCVIL